MKKPLLIALGILLLALCGGANAVAQEWPDPQSRSARSWLSDLEDENEGVRIAAAHALWRIGPDSTVDVQALIAALEDESHSVRLYAAMALLLGNDTGGGREEAAMVLGLADMDVETVAEPALLGAKNEAATLIRAFQDEDPRVRVGALIGLRRIGAEPATTVPALIDALEDERAEVRMVAITSLNLLGPEAKDAVPALIELLTGDDPFIRMSAARTLGTIGPEAEAAIPALVAMMTYHDESINWRTDLVLHAVAADGLVGIGERAVPPLTGLLEHEDSDVRSMVAGALQAIESGTTMRDLLMETRERLYMAAMRADLRRLVNAEEAYFADSTAYTADLTKLSYFEASSGVRITISLSETAQGWRATARYDRTSIACQIFIGDATPSDMNEGEPFCEEP